MNQVNKFILLLLLIIPSFIHAGNKELKIIKNAYAPDGHIFQGHNQYSSLLTYKGNIYIFSLDSIRRPYINKIDETNSSKIETALLDIDENDIYRVYDDGHHRFSLGIDEDGYIHVIGDMHHGSGDTGAGGSGRIDSDNPLPVRFHGAYGGQMYWVSDNPEDISSFTFVGKDKQRRFPCNRTTYNYFRQDREGTLYLAARQSVREPKSHEGGTLGLCLARYDNSSKQWIMLGATPLDSYALEGYDYVVPSILWEPYGYYVSEDSQWYQSYYSNIKFDKNNIMHLTVGINADGEHDSSTHIVYAYSKDKGDSFYKVDGTKIESLPMRISDTELNRPTIVLSQTKDDVVFEAMFPALFWDKDNAPAISYYNVSDTDNNRTTYRFYNKSSDEWYNKEFDINVESIRSDHYALNDGSMLVIGNRFQIHQIKNFSDEGTVHELSNDDRATISNKYFLREIDKRLLRDKDTLRGISEINGRGVVLSVGVPKTYPYLNSIFYLLN